MKTYGVSFDGFQPSCGWTMYKHVKEELIPQLEREVERWRVRRDAAASERFEAALDNMNEQLYDTMQAMAQTLAQQDRMTPELGLRMMGDATTILAETYEKIGACVPQERRGEVSEMRVFDFIDPGVAEPLIAVQGKLDGMDFRGPR